MITPIIIIRHDDDNLLNTLSQYWWGFLDTAILLIQGWKIEYTESSLLKFANILWTPYIETNESDSTIQIITPKPDEAYEQTSNSSSVDLELHIENIWTKNVPDYVGLGCISNYEKADTLYIYPQELLDDISGNSPELYRLLFENQYFFLEPESFRKSLHHTRRQRTSEEYYPVFSWSWDRITINLDLDAISSDSQIHRDAMIKFKNIILENVKTICLIEWDILFIRNTAANGKYVSCMHGRSKFEVHQESPRLLKRIFIRD